jgi:hypothetical protein
MIERLLPSHNASRKRQRYAFGLDPNVTIHV